MGQQCATVRKVFMKSSVINLSRVPLPLQDTSKVWFPAITLFSLYTYRPEYKTRYYFWKSIVFGFTIVPTRAKYRPLHYIILRECCSICVVRTVCIACYVLHSSNRARIRFPRKTITWRALKKPRRLFNKKSEDVCNFQQPGLRNANVTWETGWKCFIMRQTQSFFTHMVRRVFEESVKWPSGFFKDHRIFIFQKIQVLCSVTECNGNTW